MSGYARNKRWRKKHPKKWQAGKKRYYKQFQNAPNSGNKWTEKELNAISAIKRPSDRKLSQRFGRSVGTIQVMRSKLKN